MRVLKEIFTEKYVNNSWKGSESKSGPGSSVARKKDLLEKLQLFVESNGIRSILDCACGDFNWMKEFNFDLVEKYTGVDIVPDIIKHNAQYSDRKIGFAVMDITERVPAGYDLILCNDCLFHLSYDDASAALENIRKSGALYFISTTFTEHENKDIESGNWRPINLEKEPFKLKRKIAIWENIENNEGDNADKGVGIWKINR